MQNNKKNNTPASNCECCSNYIYDEDYECYVCDVNLDEDEMYLCFNTNISPCVIRPVTGDDFLYLVLPVRIYA